MWCLQARCNFLCHFWRVAVVAVFLLVPSSVMACDSYEHCMNPEIVEPQINGLQWSADMIQLSYVKAIAYKLDEISHKLDRLPEPSPFQMMAQKAGKKK